MNLPNPENRHEIFLASAAGMNINKPEPMNREEIYLNAIASGSGGDFDPDSYYTKPQTDARITEKVAEIVADAPEDFDTLKEMSDWIASHESSAAAMNSAIQQNTTAIVGKVDKVAGKSLSTNDYTTAEKTKLAGIDDYANYIAVDSVISSVSDNPVKGSVIYTALEDKVDKVTGKGLSTEDFTTAEKTKLAGIETGAKVNIQSDWEQSDNTADDFIKNKPTLGSAASRSVVLSLSNAGSGLPTSGTVYSALQNKVDKVTGKGLSTEDYTTEEKTKLASIEEGATKTIVDTNLSSTSTNPVQNKIINSALANYIPLSGSSTIAGNLIPITSNNIDFGSSDKYWNKAYVTKIIIGSYSMNIRTYDCDTAIDSGHYVFYGSGKTSNLPSTAGDSEFGILVVYRSGEYCMQIVYMLGKKTAHIRYTNNLSSNPFTSWVQIFSFSS